MITWLGRIAIASGIVLTSFPGLPTAPARAQSCVPLGVLGENGTQVHKEVSPPSTGVTRSNWHTDFVVPSTQAYNEYVVNVVPEDGGEYQIQMNLKYNDDTADTVYNETINLQSGQPLTISTVPRTTANPYQVNLQVGGPLALGNSYSATVSGCY